MASPRRQVRVGKQWLYADDAQKALREAIRIQQEEDRAHGEQHHEPWIRRYVFSTDHKWIGIQYGITALCFLLFGFSLMLLMRLQLTTPGKAWGILKILGQTRAPGGIMLPEAYNQLGAMHGTIMVFLAIVNVPFICETPQYGCGSTAMYDFIQPCTSHLMRNGVISTLSNFFVEVMPCTGWPSLNCELMLGIA